MLTDHNGQRLSLGQVMKKITNRLQSVLLDFKLYGLYLTGFVPSHFFRNTIYLIAGISLGKNSTFHMWARFFEPKNIKIGLDTIIGDHAFLDGRDKIIIGDHVDVASEVRVYNSEHDINSDDFHAILAPVEIGDYVFIGPRVTIMPGVTIGRGAVVAGGAVVTKNVADFSIVGGIPAKIIGIRSNQNPHYRLGRARLFQ